MVEGNYYVLPINWADGEFLTRPEKLLARRLGIKTDLSLGGDFSAVEAKIPSMPPGRREGETDEEYRTRLGIGELDYEGDPDWEGVPEIDPGPETWEDEEEVEAEDNATALERARERDRERYEQDVWGDIEEPEPGVKEENKLEGARVLAFGHSQIQDSRYGDIIDAEVRSRGGEIVRLHHGGHDDKKLIGKLDRIPKKEYTHAFLFLGGNTGSKVSTGNLQESSKKEIINFMIEKLRVPKENILVILPPVNLDHKYSKNRLKLSQASVKIFQSMGVKVAEVDIGNKEDFAGDGFHISKKSDLAKQSVSRMLGTFFNIGEVEGETPEMPDAQDDISPEGRLNPKAAYNYLKSKHDVSHAHAAGMLANMLAESGIKPGKKQVQGPGRGLFQYEGPRREKLMKYLDKNFSHLGGSENWGQIWKGQIDYAMTENWTKRYLKKDFSKPGSGKPFNADRDPKVSLNTPEKRATWYFCVFWERPRGKEDQADRRVREHLPVVARFIGRTKDDKEEPEVATSSSAGTTRYNAELNDILGVVPYTGTSSKPKVDSKWISDNIVRAPLPIEHIMNGRGSARVNKKIAKKLSDAIEESRSTYGLPLTHIGSFTSKGSKDGLSSHAWGAAIDLDNVVNPFSNDGLLDKYRIKAAINNKKGYYKRYWSFKNPATGQTYLEHLKESLNKNKPAVSLYEFVAGPLGNNGIGKIFAKYGFFWGGNYNQQKKDVMHFEFLPSKIRQDDLVAENQNTTKLLNQIFELIEEVQDELVIG